MKLQYIGMFDEVVVPEHNEGLAVGRGQTVEVDDELGQRMLEQPTNWALAEAPKGKSRSLEGGDTPE